MGSIMTGKQKKTLYRIIITAVLFVPLFIAEHIGMTERIEPEWLVFPIYLIPYLIIGYDVILEAAGNIRRGQIFDENFLMMTATFGAFAIAEYSEAVAVMLFYQVGELFQSYAVGKSRQSISDLMDICPAYANLEKENGYIKVDPDDVMPGDIIYILPGERVPLDGTVIDGDTYVDCAALTGESKPVHIKSGDSIISGSINQRSTVKVRVEKAYEDSTVAKILELVENASSKKAKVENFITRFARYYTPVVTIGALLLAVIPSVITGEWNVWLERACIFLVVSCPCALVISVPMGFFGGIGAASRIRVLVKGSNYLETLAETDTVVFDKTGTLTCGSFKVSSIIPFGISKQELLETAAYAEAYSTHPIAVSIREEYESTIDFSRIGKEEEIAGRGVSAEIDGAVILAGNDKLVSVPEGFKASDNTGTVVYVSKGGAFLGALVISDEIKAGAKEAIEEMKRNGIKSCVMLTGDRREVAEAVAEKLSVDRVCAELLPADKVAEVERLFSEKTSGNGKIAFAGDGINDAPVLMRADVGIAMGSLGSDAAIEAADIVIMDDDIRRIPAVKKIARKTLTIVKQNIVFALLVKGLILLLGAAGYASMWAAVFADVGVAVLAILNSMRTLRNK